MPAFNCHSWSDVHLSTAFSSASSCCTLDEGLASIRSYNDIGQSEVVSAKPSSHGSPCQRSHQRSAHINDYYHIDLDWDSPSH